MEASRARAIAREVDDGIRIFGGSGSWDDLETGARDRWAGELLARIVSSIGEEESIQYVSGWVEEETSVEGSVVVFTETRFIRANFTALQQGAPHLVLDATVQILKRERIVSILVLSAGSLPPEDGASVWSPRARLSLQIEGEDDPLILPPSRRGNLSDATTAAFIARVL